MEAEAPPCGGDAPAPACPWSGCGLLPLREHKAKARTVWTGNGSPIPKGREAPYDASREGRHHSDFFHFFFLLFLLDYNNIITFKTVLLNFCKKREGKRKIAERQRKKREGGKRKRSALYGILPFCFIHEKKKRREKGGGKLASRFPIEGTFL